MMFSGRLPEGEAVPGERGREDEGAAAQLQPRAADLHALTTDYSRLSSILAMEYLIIRHLDLDRSVRQMS